MGDRYDQFYERDEARRSTMGSAQTVLAAFLGLVMPVSYSAKLYLVRELQKFGVDTSAFPEPCLRSLADKTVSLCKFASKMRGRPWRSELTGNIEGMALLIAHHLRGDREDMTLPENVADILREYGLARGSTSGAPIRNDWSAIGDQ